MKKFSKRNFIIMTIGIIILGLGVALFKMSVMGNDPSSAMMMAIGDRIHIDFSIVLIVLYTLFFLIQFLFGRKYIGAGTFVNWFLTGTIASFFIRQLEKIIPSELDLISKVLVMLIGVLVLSFGASLYQTANMGIAPYDVLSILMAEYSPVPYFFCRMFTDGICALTAYLLGGIIGLGTLICALGLGPFISFFNRTVAEKVCE